jgi:hypothetical protein
LFGDVFGASIWLSEWPLFLSLELRGGIDTAVGYSGQDVIEDDEATCFVKDHGVQLRWLVTGTGTRSYLVSVTYVPCQTNWRRPHPVKLTKHWTYVNSGQNSVEIRLNMHGPLWS